MGRKKKKRIPLYKKCTKCGSHAYLTTGKFYFCTNEECLYKEYVIASDKSIQMGLEEEVNEEDDIDL